MSLITLPNLNRWSTAKWVSLTGDTVLETMNGGEQIIKGVAKKRYEISLVNLNGDERRLWGIALDQLTSFENTFKAPPPEFQGPSSGYGGPNPSVNGSSQLGKALNVDGAPASTELLKAGDFFTVNSELKRSTEDVISSGTGTATLNFYPALRTSPLDNEPIIIDAPTIELRLLQSMTSMELDSTLNGSSSIVAIETYFP